MSKYSSGKAGLLKDNSWIKKPDDEEEAVDQDPNFGRSVLGRTRADETSVSSSEADPVKSGTGSTKPSSVLSLSKRFGGSPDDPNTSSVSTTKPSTTYQKKYSTVKTDTPSSVTTTIREEPKTSTTTTTVTKNGVTTETTTTTSSSSSSQIIKSPEIKTSTAFTERVKTSSKDAQYSTYTPTKTTKVTERTVISTKDTDDKLLDNLLKSTTKDDFSNTNSKTTVTTTETVKVKGSSDAAAEDKLYDSLIPRSIKSNTPDSKSTLTSYETVTIKSSITDDADDDFTPSSFKDSSSNIKTSLTSTETWTVKNSSNIDTKTTKTSFVAEDQLYDSLLPKAITSSPISTSKKDIVENSKGSESPTLSTPTSLRTSRPRSAPNISVKDLVDVFSNYSSYTDDSPSSRSSSYSNSYSKTYSYSRPDTTYEYTSVTSPSVFASPSYKSSSWSDDTQTSLSYSKSSSKSLYQTPERTVLEKDLCTVCRKPFTGDAKMVLDDININCHATCFKCNVCNGSLSKMKAGDSIWIYKRMVHCENCFEDTRDKWRR